MRSIIIFTLLFSASVSFGQAIKEEKAPVAKAASSVGSPDLQILVTNVIGKHMVLDSVLKIPDNQSYLYSVALSFDSIGKMIQVYFSKNMRKSLMEILSPNDLLKSKIISKWNSSNGQKEIYKNKTVIFPILLQNYNSASIANLNEFLTDYTNLWPELNSEDQTKEKILLKPFPNYIHKSVN